MNRRGFIASAVAVAVVPIIPVLAASPIGATLTIGFPGGTWGRFISMAEIRNGFPMELIEYDNQIHGDGPVTIKSWDVEWVYDDTLGEAA